MFLQRLKKIDPLVLLSALIIVGTGLYYLKSASEVYYAKQLMWLVLGFCVMSVMFVIDYRWLLKQGYLIYTAGIGLLLYVMLFGDVVNGAKSWIKLPGFNVQPSELMKIVLILALARNLMNRGDQWTIRGLILPFILTFIPLGFIMKQPDLGTAILLPPLLFAMVYTSGARLLHLASVAFAGIASALPLWVFFMKEYQKNRIRAFINPEQYSAREAWQIINSLIAIGSGGLYGMGWGQGSQNSLDLLPEKHTDFIFGVIAEEGGFVIACGLLFMFFLFILGGLHIARRCPEPGGKLIAVGVSTIIGVQALVNIAVVTALMPTTGIPLPLVSYGGSSMLVTFAMIGLLLNVGSTKPRIMTPLPFTGMQKNED